MDFTINPIHMACLKIRTLAIMDHMIIMGWRQ